jgi:hypothetical protein
MQQVAKKTRTVKRTGHVRDYALCIAIIVVVNVLIFHNGLYKYVCRPDSYAGNVYGRLSVLEQIESQTNQRPLIIMGDSTIEDGISAQQLTQINGTPVANLAMPATGPLVWLQYFRSIDPDRDRFQTIVILITPQDVREIPHEEGIQSLIAIAPPHVLWSYLTHFRDPWNHLSDFYASIDRLYAFRRDLGDLILSPDRLLNASQRRKEHHERLRTWPGEQTDVCEVQLNPSLQTVRRWGPVKDRELRKVINKTLSRTNQLNKAPTVSGMIYPVEDIVRYYEGSGVKILLVSFPFGWNHRVDLEHPVIQDFTSRLNKLDSSPSVRFWDATQLPLFQNCENYYDFRHLNVRGREEFTAELGRTLKQNAF